LLPPRSTHHAFSRRVWLGLAFSIALIAAAWRVATLGRLLFHEDPLQKADVIFVLGGTRLERAAESGDLYLAGWAPRILLSRQAQDGAEIEFARRGMPMPTEPELQRDALVRMGVPADAIEIVTDDQPATAMESDVLATTAAARHWRTVIVVTSKLHTARAALSMRRRLDGTGVQVVMRSSRYDPSDVDRWWTTRGTFRFVLFETQKLFAYWIGIAD
jgi:uncharacterized SAM-binding protein YcdF (DUF218 family)